MVITYVTITYNAATVLQRTLDSVLRQDYPDIVHIIIDGASTDGTLEMVNDYISQSNEADNGHKVLVTSEPDHGIYDAMNKGLRSIDGDYVCFLNAGDFLPAPDTVSKIVASVSQGDPAVLYGDTDIVDGEGRFLHHRRLSPPEQLTWKSFRHGMLVCHQAFYARADFAIATPYDLRYRYSADVDWCIRIMKAAAKENVPMQNLHMVVANYTEEGQTTFHHRESLLERFRIMTRHYGWLSTLAMHAWFVLRMGKALVSHLKLLLVAVLLAVGSMNVYADKTVDELEGKDRDMYDMFRHLFLNGKPDQFYSFAEEYAKDLHQKGYMMLYYKLLCNKGFYALRHNQVYRAIQFAEALDREIRENGASDYNYLATGLYGDIYSSTRDIGRAEAYFSQALDEVGDRDVKFTMRVYLRLAEMLCMKNPQEALTWVDKSVATAREVDNIDYLSMSLAIKAYIFFNMGDKDRFFPVWQQYDNLRNQDLPEFNHRYDNIMEVAKYAFNKEYEKAMEKVHAGNLAVDSSLSVITIYALKGDITQGFMAMRRRSIEMDSIFNIVQNANFNQLSAETSLSRTREEAASNRKLVNRLTNWLMVLTVVFLFVYIMGRRRLMKKIKARNKELKAALSRAEESDRMKTTFIQSMSHEIRTPLNAVSGFTEVLCSTDSKYSDEEKRDMQRRISSNVELITSIINELLELSKSESEDVIADSEKTDVWVNSIARSIVEESKGKQKAGVELRFETNVADDFKIRTNTYRLKKALTHLMDNAIKFTELGHIELCCEHQGSQLRFVVTDTGCGVKEEDRERIFETFQKADDFKTGVGLGLPICRRLIHSLGGEVSLDTNYITGACFIITLPCDDKVT